MLKNLPITKKLSIAITGLGLFAALVTGFLTYKLAEDLLYKQAEIKMGAITQAQHRAITNYLESIETDLRFQSASPFVQQAFLSFDSAWRALPPAGPTEYLHQHYISRNPNPAGQKELMNAAADGSVYSQYHAQFHPALRHFLKERGYYDIFLINPQGQVVYTVFKELDFATNVLNGPWKESDLGKLFKKIAANPEKNAISFTDFMPYAPSNNVPASFVGKRMYDANGRWLGVLAFQMPIEKINTLMQGAHGLGKTGETYLVGENALLRSDSKFDKESSILTAKVPKEYLKAFKKKSMELKTKNFLGRDVVVRTQRLSFNGTQWLVVAEQGQKELFAAIEQMQHSLIIQLLVIAGVLVAAGLGLGKSLAGPIQAMVQAMRELAGGNTNLTIPCLEQKDELGEMAETVEVFQQNAIQKNRLTQQLMNLADSLERNVHQSFAAMLNRTQGLHTAAALLNEGAQTTLNRLSNVSVSSAQMSEAANEISTQVTTSHHVVEQATSKTEEAQGLMHKLAASTGHIGEVVTLIRGITNQTNLLALNATIEASRAGEAGKGFAVVANEVKQLAGQTSTATEEVAKQIQSIQSESNTSVHAMEAISSVIEQVSASSRSIAAAVEEQTFTLRDMAENISTVNGEAEGFLVHIKEVSGAAEELIQQSKKVEEELQSFLVELRNSK